MPLFNQHQCEGVQVKESHEGTEMVVQSDAHSDQLEMPSIPEPISEPYKSMSRS